MNPTTLQVQGSGFGTEVPNEISSAEAATLFGLTGATPDDAKLVCWNGHEFEVIAAEISAHPWQEQFSIGGSFIEERGAAEYVMEMYYPIDHRTTAEDWQGALAAEPNEWNDGWLPKWDADVPLDHEHALLSAVSQAFEEEGATLRQAHDQATHDADVSESARPTLASTRHTLAAFDRFRRMVKAHIIDACQTHPCLLYTSPSPRDS